MKYPYGCKSIQNIVREMWIPKKQKPQFVKMWMWDDGRRYLVNLKTIRGPFSARDGHRFGESQMRFSWQVEIGLEQRVRRFLRGDGLSKHAEADFKNLRFTNTI